MSEVMRRPKRIMVTGGCGFIGGAVLRRALAEDLEVVNLDALTYAATALPEEVTKSSNYSFLRVDLRDAIAVRKAIFEIEPDAVLHLAAESHVDRSIHDPALFLETNIIGTANLLSAVRDSKAGTKDGFVFHHISTDEVFGDLSLVDPPFSEASSYNPSSPYSASKASSDFIVRSWARTYDIKTVITNCSNNYGPRQHDEKLIPSVIRSARHGDPISIYGNGQNIRDWIHVDDHVAGLLQVMRRGRIGETYCIGGNCEITNLDLVRQICQILDDVLGRRFEGGHFSLVNHVEDRMGHDFRYAISNQKIEYELGWKPTIDLESGLKQTVEWYLARA